MSWVWRRFGRDVRRRPERAAALLLGFAAMALMGAAAAALSRTATRMAAQLSEETHVVAYLDDALDEPHASALAALLARLPGVQKTASISATEAAARLRAAAPLGAADALGGGLEAGFFPRSIEITLSPGRDLGSRVHELETRLRRLPGIAEVDATTEGLGRLESWQRTAAWVSRALPIAAAALGAALLVVLTGGARDGRADEARALLLVGHTPWQIRWPSGLLGLLCAVAGGVGGLAVTSFVLRAAAKTGVVPFAALPPLPALTLGGRDLVVALAALALAGLGMGLASQRIPRTGLGA